jgi:hypothetical protein
MAKTLEQCNKESLEYFRTNNGQPTEFDMSINDISRDTIEAMHYEKGACWLGKINLYNKNEKPFKLVKWTPGTIAFNFQYDFILPVHDTEIENMINDRDQTPFNTRIIYDKGNAIIERVRKLGGVLLTWA